MGAISLEIGLAFCCPSLQATAGKPAVPAAACRQRQPVDQELLLPGPAAAPLARSAGQAGRPLAPSPPASSQIVPTLQLMVARNSGIHYRPGGWL